jgi:hypothetical protein
VTYELLLDFVVVSNLVASANKQFSNGGGGWAGFQGGMLYDGQWPGSDGDGAVNVRLLDISGCWRPRRWLENASSRSTWLKAGLHGFWKNIVTFAIEQVDWIWTMS